ncbi:hypothetical protein PILCRDRAFT_307091 [Piloderma croceum F 1598]|uniref:SET domain-containing protein n=1 Tax=Piloderma croceum (strain F 1598) TaxID=765440 RepID=A0A0C3C9X9_PILCF|nr:hypothetical protein PILCRDRAFT_307091 [Piloderma croceum F 1598]
MSDHEIWQDSATSAEDWGDDGDDGEWPVNGIIGEEVNTAGEIKYEVAWSTWKRSDGSNTTWMPDLSDRPDLVKSWKRRQNQRRRELAEESLDIEVLHTIDIHNANTVRRAQVLLDKTRRRKGRMVGYKQWDLELEKNLDRLNREMVVGTESWSRSLRGNSSRTNEIPLPKAPSVAPSVISISESSSSSGSRDVSRSRASHSSSSGSATLSSAPMASNPTKFRQSLSPQSPVIEPRPSRPLPRRVTSLAPAKPKPSRREALQTAWNIAARKAAAAAIFVVNDIDEEEVPPMVQDFEYCEDIYIYSRDIPVPNIEYLLACECAECVSAVSCSCQLSSDRDDLPESFAYVNGLFTFELPQGAEVIECNKRCSCGATCPNRVAQQPRQFPVEIFKTESCGWGARATVALERGQVLGIYTGKLIQRAAAETLPEEHKGYVFDLDSREGDDDDSMEGKYSVDSYECGKWSFFIKKCRICLIEYFTGNWTRFVNHACNPNTRVYPVLYDTIPQMNQPYLAFVATQDIPARMEFTLSYNPAASAVRAGGDGKGKLKVPEGALSCHCSSTSCLGWR